MNQFQKGSRQSVPGSMALRRTRFRQDNQSVLWFTNPRAGGLTEGVIPNKITNSTGFLQISSPVCEVAR